MGVGGGGGGGKVADQRPFSVATTFQNPVTHSATPSPSEVIVIK